MTGCSPRAPTKRRGGAPEYLTFERVIVVPSIVVLACPEVHEWRMVEELGGSIENVLWLGKKKPSQREKDANSRIAPASLFGSWRRRLR